MTQRILFAIIICLSAVSCSKLNDLDQRVDNLESKVAVLESKLNDMEASVETLLSEGKLTEEEAAELLAEIDALELRLTSDESNLDQVELSVNDLLESLDYLLNTDVYQSLAGKVEKGGFLQGSLLYLYELSDSLAQTGRTFNAIISDDFGSFGLDVQNLKGRTCRVIADGFYYNEVQNTLSTSKISLAGLVKVDSGEVINVNVLTHLEMPRVEYLIRQGLSFDSAKTKALTEVLDAFGIQNPGIKRAEKVGLVGSEEENGVLLGLSTTLLGFRSDSELTEILSIISNDLKEDGVLNNTTVGDELLTHIYYMDTSKVLDQVRTKYNNQVDQNVLDALNFKYVREFENNSGFTNLKNLISYPATGQSALPNLLHSSHTSINASSFFEINLDLKADLDVTIEFVREDGASFSIAYALGTTLWFVEQDNGINTGVFKTTEPGIHNLSVSLDSPGNYEIIFYEKGGVTETSRKSIVVN